ncbi:unnamed protein product [Moneuplotes crassus]|uniref:Uncharacterized protein n=1 Tax=Euplotes crassus TaxID=5936 RepID=A0AAD1XZA7_EUPCR|nr:unnamed protein product [Moneuplotes crassus]
MSFFYRGFNSSFGKRAFRFNRCFATMHIPNAQKQLISNYLKSQVSLPLSTGNMMSIILNNNLVLQNMVNSSLDELEESTMASTSEDLDELSKNIDVLLSLS